MNNTCGRVYWITGLSGAGKTTVGLLLYDWIKHEKTNVIRLDGDLLREVFSNTEYTRDARKELSYQYARLCKMISDQGIDVVICTIAMFDDVREWNRKNISDYFEVYLEVSEEELTKRDQKGLYTGKNADLSGITQIAELPKTPDIVIKNYGQMTPQKAAQMIIDRIDKGNA